MNNRLLATVVLSMAIAFWGHVVTEAQDSDKPAVSVRAFASGIGRHTPGQWTPLGIQALNTTDADTESLIAVYFGKESNIQFARRLWVPAHSVRMGWLPVHIPLETGERRDSLEMTMMTLTDSPQGELIERRDGQELLRTALLLIDREQIKTAAIFRKPVADEFGNMPELDSDVYELMAVARQMNEYSRVIMDLSQEFLPSHSMMWETVDQVILSSDRILDDSAGLAVVRDWLHRGGRLCVFLDRVSHETVAAILGHAIGFQVVDRVELDEFEIENLTYYEVPGPPDRRRFEEPVELVRVATDSKNVLARVNGWPAAFTQQAGSGEVLLLALAPRGWSPSVIRPGEEKLPESTEPEFRQTQALRALSERFYRPRGEEVAAASIGEALLQEQIGYRIPSRALAMQLLFFNCVAVVFVGAWCSRRHRLDRMAWILPLLAIPSTAIFLVIGWTNTKSVPATVAFTQLVQVFPDTDEANVSGLAAFYYQETTDMTMGGGVGGTLRPTAKPLEGATRRLIWSDNDRGKWKNVTLPGGSVQFATFRQRANLNKPISAVAQFVEDGLQGQVEAGSLGRLEDALLANPPAPPLAVRMNPDGTFACGLGDLLPAEQYLAQTVLSDESRRRQEAYRSILNPADNVVFPTTASVLGWSAPLDCGIDWPADLQTQGTAMTTIPLTIRRTPPGTKFLVPATFLRAELAAGAAGRSMSYNPRTGRWLPGASRATNTRLRFPLPPEVLPGRVNSATMTVRVNAPSRSLAVYAVVDGRDELVRNWPNPSGVYSVTFDQPEHLGLDERGGLTFTLQITEAEEERKAREEFQRQSSVEEPPQASVESTPGEESSGTRPNQPFSTWQIDYVQLNVRGETN